MAEEIVYDDSSIKSLDWDEHIRLRPGMYIGKLGDGSSQDDGIYVLLKETIDNSIDEFVMGNGRHIDVTIKDGQVTVRDFGRGIPLGKLVDCVSKLNTGAKYDSKAFKKSVGLNGVGLKAVNALSSYFKIQTIRDGQTKVVEFSRGKIVSEGPEELCTQRNGTITTFVPDDTIFKQYKYRSTFIEPQLRNYAYLNTGLTINFNGEKFFSKDGLKDLLDNYMDTEPLYPPIHIREEDFEFVFTHSSSQDSEENYSFVNGQHTTQGGTHVLAFREALVKTIRDFYKKNFEVSDIKTSLVAAISIKIQEPVFESQTKTKLGSSSMTPEDGSMSVRNFIGDIVKRNLDNYLHKNPDVADIIHKKILASEKERKEIAGVKKAGRENMKKVSLHNKKLRDCRAHYNSNHERKLETMIFITEGDSASGSITKSRDVNTQAVFSLKGKPLNSYGMKKSIVWENEEFCLLQAALNIEEGVDDLRYNQIIIATDADTDGMHIRLLLLTFFLQFYPEVVKSGHLYILQTPLFRVRNKQKTFYCYDEKERLDAIEQVGKNHEITRFKGLGEISPDEFKNFIGGSIRLDPVIMRKDSHIADMLRFYMGKNSDVRLDFIVSNLRKEEE